MKKKYKKSVPDTWLASTVTEIVKLSGLRTLCEERYLTLLILIVSIHANFVSRS